MAVTITRRQLREGAAHDAGLMVRLENIVAADIDGTNMTLDLPQLFTKFPDSLHLQDAFITEDGDDYARIIKYHQEGAPHKVVVDHIPAGLSGTGLHTSAQVYFLLSPEDWNDCLNEALEGLFRPVRVSITIVDNDSEYPMDGVTDADLDLATWLQTRAQVYALEYRSASGVNISLEQLGGVRFIENNNSLTVHLLTLPLAGDSGTLVLVARKPYVWRGNTLDLDTDTTVCPYKLGMVAAQVKAYSLLFKRHGQNMKQQFAAASVIAEREYVRLVNEYVPAMRPVPYTYDEHFAPDIPAAMGNWSW